MSLDHNRVPAGSQCHFELRDDDARECQPRFMCWSSARGPYMEGQMCVFVIRRAQLERGKQQYEAGGRECKREMLSAELSPHRSQ